MSGTTDVDGMLAGMTADQFNRWLARDMVQPLNHTARCLGLIAQSLIAFMGGDSDADDLSEALMPWLKYAPEDKPQNLQAMQMLSGAPRG